MYYEQSTLLVPVAVVVAGKVLERDVGFDVSCEVVISVVERRSARKPLTIFAFRQ